MPTVQDYILMVETPEIVAKLRQDGIVHIYIKANTHINLDVQQRMFAVYDKLTDIPRPFIFESGEFVSVSKEAQAHAVETELERPVICLAIVVKNLGQKIIAESYYKFNKPKKPLKVFNSLDKAVDWSMDNFL